MFARGVGNERARNRKIGFRKKFGARAETSRDRYERFTSLPCSQLSRLLHVSPTLWQRLTANNMPKVCEDNAFNIILEKARRRARETRQYDSEKTRAGLTQVFKLVYPGQSPLYWQLDIAEALILKLDCLLSIETGADMTISMVLALLLPENENKSIIILSPMKEMQRRQARRSSPYMTTPHITMSRCI